MAGEYSESYRAIGKEKGYSQARNYCSHRVWKSKAVVTKSKQYTRITDKHKVLLRDAVCGVTSYDDID